MGTRCNLFCPRSNATEYTAGFLAGLQQAAMDTYQPNLDATAEREATELERQHHTRWSE